MEEKKELNLLLIGMSKLARKPSESYYKYTYKETEDGKDEGYFCGISQLEAGTKCYMRRLQREGRKIDKIFIVESVEARKEFAEPEQQNTHCFSEEDMNAVGFYKGRIRQYILGMETTDAKDESSEYLAGYVQEYEKGLKEKEKEGQLKPLSKLYPEGYGLFEDIELKDVIDGDSDEEEKTDENAIYSCASGLCNKIDCYQDEKTEVKLFIDMQGARRFETFIINAAVKMLSTRGIKVESSLATNFDPDNNKKYLFNEIVDTTMNDRMFDMVSGMQEFINTGRGDTLQEFLEHSTINLTAEKEIIDSIQKISDAISLCDVNGFDEGLQEFRVNIETYNKLEGGKDSLFQTFVKDLKNDYDEYHLLETLTEENKAVSNKTLDQIRWCLKKKLYQQALTLVEAKIPDYLVDHKFIYYKNDDELKNLINSFADNGEYDTEGRWNWKWRLEKYFYDMADENENFDDPHRWIKPGKEKYVWIKHVIGWKPFYKDDPMEMQPDEIIGLGVKAQFMYERVNLSRGRQNANNIAIAKVLFAYRKICIIRNEVNHAFETDAPPVSVEDVEDAVNVLLDMIQECRARVDLYKYNC